MALRQTLGAIIYDWPPFALHMLRGDWLRIHNRAESIESNGRGVRCQWRFTSDLHIANVFPFTGAWLMRRALARWPMVLRDAPEPAAAAPQVSFLIGHRGTARLPQLLATLRSIAGQRGAAIECIVVEQADAQEVCAALPSWVRYLHTPLPRPDLPYGRAWAFNVAARAASSDVLVLHDGDLLVPDGYAAEALARVREGYGFADLKRFLFYLGDDETQRLETGVPVRRLRPATVVQNPQGGSVVASRDAYFSIGGFDESFVGWGGEDNDFWDRARTTGTVWDFGYLPLIHLHHEAQPGKIGGTAAVERYRRLESVPPATRIERLLRREQGRAAGPALDDVSEG